MENKERIIKETKKYNYKLGCYDLEIEKLNPSNLKKVLDIIKYGDSTDVAVFINRKKYIVEISVVDNEVDLQVLTLKEYENRYGEWED